MKRIFKKYFIPHKHNEHKPYLLRTNKAVAIFLGILFIEFLFLVQVFIIFPSSGFLAAVLPSVLIDSTNTARADTELPGLRANPLLTEAAKLKAEDMAKKGYFAHTSPEGISPWYWLGKAGYKFSYAGENLAVNFIDSEDVIYAWLNSDGHRANILNKNFSEIGIATAKGRYKNRETVFVVQFFGRPQLKSVAASGFTKGKRIKKEEPVKFLTVKTGAQKKDMFIENAAGLSVRAEEEAKLKDGKTIKSVGPQNQESTFIGRVASEPRTIANYIFIFLAAVVSLALALKIFVNVKIQHPRLIVNGLVLLFVIFSAFILNGYFALSEAVIF